MSDQATTAVDPATAVSIGVSDRASAYISQLEAEANDPGETDTADEPANNNGGETPPAAAQQSGDSAGDDKPGPDADARKAARDARQANLAKLREKQQAALAQKQERQQVEQLQRELEQLRSKATGPSLEELFADPEKLVAAFEKHADADRLIELIRRKSDPSAATKSGASDLDKLEAKIRAELQKELAETKALAEQAARREQERESLAAKTSAEKDFLAALAESPEDFPLVEAFRAKLGDDQLIAMAHAIGPSLPEGASYADLHDEIQKHLEVFASLGQPATTKPETDPAKAKAKPLRNAAAGARTAVDDEDGPRGWDERLARALDATGGRFTDGE